MCCRNRLPKLVLKKSRKRQRDHENIPLRRSERHKSGAPEGVTNTGTQVQYGDSPSRRERVLEDTVEHNVPGDVH